MAILNLMPPVQKEEIKYARLNQKLITLSILCSIVIAAMGVMIIGGSLYIDSTKASIESSVKQSQSEFANQKLDTVKTQAEQLSKDVNLVMLLLSKEVLFSKLLKQIGTVMPPSTILGDMQLSNKVTNALDLKAYGYSFASTSLIQTNLQDPKSKLFEKVNTINVACSDKSVITSQDGAGDSRYKCEISMRALFSAEAAATFLAATPLAATATSGAAK